MQLICNTVKTTQTQKKNHSKCERDEMVIMYDYSISESDTCSNDRWTIYKCNKNVSLLCRSLYSYLDIVLLKKKANFGYSKIFCNWVHLPLLRIPPFFFVVRCNISSADFFPLTSLKSQLTKRLLFLCYNTFHRWSLYWKCLPSLTHIPKKKNMLLVSNL
jgi:hypothetical protein